MSRGVIRVLTLGSFFNIIPLNLSGYVPRSEVRRYNITYLGKGGGLELSMCGFSFIIHSFLWVPTSECRARTLLLGRPKCRLRLMDEFEFDLHKGQILRLSPATFQITLRNVGEVLMKLGDP